MSGSLRIAVISTPRSGNNWLRHVLSGVFEIPPMGAHSPAEVGWDTLAPECVLGIHWHPTPRFLEQLERHGFQVVVLARHPLDVLISVLQFARDNAHTEATQGWLAGEGGDERSISGVTPRSSAFLEYATGERAAALLSISDEWWRLPGCRQLRYEDLLEQPQAAVGRLATELGVAPRRPVPEVLARTTLPKLRALSGSASHFWQGRAGLWRSLLTAAEAERIAEAHGPVFSSLGYSCDPDPGLDGAGADARWIRLTDGHGATHVATIATVSELAHARVLAAMLVDSDPVARLHCLVLDDVEETVNPAGEPFEILRPADLDLPEFDRLAGRLGESELRARVKPALIRAVLESTGGAPAIFLDVDSAVYGDLTPLLSAAQSAGIAVVARLREPVPFDGRHPDVADVLAAGVFDDGCFALAPSDSATELLALAELAMGAARAGGERWLDLTPAVFPDAILVRDPGIAVAQWNLHERRVERHQGRLFADDRPLRILRLNGLGPQRTGGLDPAPRVDLSYRPVLAELCSAHADALLAAGSEAVRDQPYGFAGPFHGRPLDAVLQQLWDEGAETGALAQPPFTTQGAEAFLNWLAEPATQVPGHGLSRFWWRVWSARKDLGRAFPGVPIGDVDAYLGWVHAHGRLEHEVPEALTPGDAGAADSPHLGVNVVAPVGSRAAGQLIAALDAAGIPVHLEPAPGSGAPTTPFPITLLVGGPRRFDELAAHLGDEARAGRIHLGFFSWALEGTPIEARAVGLLDEVWVPSEHVARGARGQLGCPVVTVRVPVQAPASAGPSRADLGLPEGFLVLAVIDLRARFERKNPLAAVEAFMAAFAPDEGATLALAVSGAEANPGAAERLRRLAAEHAHVIVLEDSPLNSLLASCDCVLSLHRAEAFAVPLAQGLALGKPVIATGYSGNLEYMRPDNSYLVRAPLRAVRPGLEWADPDVDHASALLREVRARPAEARERSGRGAALIHARYSPRAAGEAIRLHLLRLAAGLRDRPRDQPPPAPAAAAISASASQT